MNQETIITDSACLISLERINQLRILPSLFSNIAIPPSVQAEFGIVLPWLQVITPQDTGMVATLKLLVDDGEAEAIALAYELKYRLIVDDLQARKVAQQLGLKITGTIGILVMARKGGVIPVLRPILEALAAEGFYLSQALKQEALKLVDELET